jgi:hypothetical protein
LGLKKDIMDNWQRFLTAFVVIILIGMLAMMAQITNLNPAGIGYGLTGLANLALMLVSGGVMAAVVVLPFYLLMKLFQRRSRETARTVIAQQLPARDLIQTDSERVRALTYAQPLEPEQPLRSVNQQTPGPKAKTRKDIPFILPNPPAPQQVTQQVIIQPPAPGIGDGTRGNPYTPATPVMPISPSPINFPRALRSRLFPPNNR